MLDRLTTNNRMFEEQLSSFDFDAFVVADTIGRQHALPSVIFKIMCDLPKGSSPILLNQDKLKSMDDKVKSGEITCSIDSPEDCESCSG